MKRKEPRWLKRHIVEIIHRSQLEEHGGLSGIRDEAALDAALARAQQKHAYGEAPEFAVFVAAYGFGFARSHPFNDGNKRIAFMLMDLFARMNGQSIETSEEDVVITMLGLAAGSLTEDQLTDWVRERLVRTMKRIG